MQLVRLAWFSSAFLVVGALAPACKSDPVERPALPQLDAVPPGAHDLARLQYNDVNDVYRAFLASAPKGPPLRLRNLRLALLTDEQIAAGKKPHLVDDGAGPVVFAGPRFKIGVLHGVVAERAREDGKRQNVVVRTERKSWAPFLAPKLVDGKSVFHTAAVHYPPPLGAGNMVGSGGSGPTRETAWDDHRRRHGFLPQAVRLEFEGYALAKDLPKDDAKDDAKDDDDDAQPASVDAGPAVKASATVDAGPGGRDKPLSRPVVQRRKQIQDIARPKAPLKKATKSPATTPTKKTSP